MFQVLIPSISFCLEPVINCEWNEWGIGECSQTCGNGTRIKIRTKKIQESPNGFCEGGSEIQDSCHIKDCPSKSIFLTSRYACSQKQ